MRLPSCALGLAILVSACGPASTPPVDTPQTLPPAAPPADLSRAPAEKAGDAGKPEVEGEQPAP